MFFRCVCGNIIWIGSDTYPSKDTPFDEGGHQKILVIRRYHISYEPDMNAESGNNNTSAYATTAELNIAYSAAIYDSEYIGSFLVYLMETGNISERDMYNTYNMGLGMIVAEDPADVDKTMEAIRLAGETPYVLGFIDDGEKDIIIK
mgnify:CR=1 FL=1